MRRILVVALTLCLFGHACGSSGPSTVAVRKAWVRATPPGATNAAMYFTITSPVEDRLLSVVVPGDVAASAEMHETMAASGGAGMANMPGMASGGGTMVGMTALPAVALGAGERVQFSPGGKHVMLAALKRSLSEGEHITVKFQMERAGALTVNVPVLANPP